MPIIYFNEKVMDVAKYEKICKGNKKCIFIFPGNSLHHTKGTTRFTPKSGGGLANLASNLGNAGYPTLSLPTTSMESWKTDKNQQDIVTQAIKDLYTSIGEGYELVLPIRTHENSTYFGKDLDDYKGFEPKFWGGVELLTNKPLADHYIAELGKLAKFMVLSEAERINQSAKYPFYPAYLEGKKLFEKSTELEETGSLELTHQNESPEDYEELESLLPKAENGDTAAQMQLGWMYEFGIGIGSKNHQKSEKFYGLAVGKDPKAVLGLRRLQVLAINQILEDYAIKVSTAPDKLKTNANNLNNTLQGYFTELKNASDYPKALQQFKENCTVAIIQALPSLDTWKEYLLNLIREVTNLVISPFTKKKANGFFTEKHTESYDNADDLKKDLSNLKSSL